MSGFDDAAGRGSAVNNANDENLEDGSPASLVREASSLLELARRRKNNANEGNIHQIMNAYQEALLQHRNTLRTALEDIGIQMGGRRRKSRKTRRR